MKENDKRKRYDEAHAHQQRNGEKEKNRTDRGRERQICISI